jgi:glycosyltransferase involved in cell wall biosynthesis
MSNIVMILSNPFRPDPRAIKQADSLAHEGHKVTIVCWDRLREMPKEETLKNGVRILRIQSVATTYGAGAKQIFYTPRFWSAAIREALPLKPKLVYCRDVDTLYAGVRLKKLLGCKLLLDAHEDYASLMSLYLPRFMVFSLNLLERYLLHYVDAAIAASSLTADKLKKEGVSMTEHIPNVPYLEQFDQVSSEQETQARQHIGLNPGAYVVSYIGGFTRNRLILPLIEAMKGLPNITLLLAGDGHQRQEIEESTRGVENIHYLGWLPAEQVPLYTRLSDVVYYCIKPDYPGSVYNSPNTLTNAMAAGRAVIANDLGDLGRIVRKTGCGILLDEVSVQSIREAVLRLSDPVLRSKLGEAGHEAALNEYNWPAMEKRLLDLYQALLPNP